MINNVVLLLSATNKETPYEQLVQYRGRAPHLRTEKFIRRRGAHSSKYGTDHWTFVARKKSY